MNPAAGAPIGKLQARQALAKLLGELEGEAALGVAGGDQVHIGRRLRGADTLGLQHLDDALDAERPADGRRFAPAELRHEPVVTAARADCALGSEPVRDPLEDRARVVVEPAHEPRIQRERHADVAEQRLHAIEVRARLVVEVRSQQRRGVDELAQRWVLAVQDPQRIAVEASQALLVEQLAMAREVLDEHLLVRLARLGRADRIELELSRS